MGPDEVTCLSHVSGTGPASRNHFSAWTSGTHVFTCGQCVSPTAHSLQWCHLSVDEG